MYNKPLTAMQGHDIIVLSNQERKQNHERMDKMGEIKQTNFRIDQEAADAFRKFCEENGMNQAQGFDSFCSAVDTLTYATFLPFPKLI